MRYLVKLAKGIEDVGADEVKFWSGGVLAFYKRDANMLELIVAYAPGSWLSVEAEEE